MRILVTGTAGFIGSATAEKLLARGDEVIGIDDLNDYYDVELKKARLARIDHPRYTHYTLDIADRDALAAAFADTSPERVIHLAAQAGVRYSLTNPHAYVDSNLVGFVNVLEACRHGGVGHLVYASSSSVYGANGALPFSVDDNVDHPLSLYAATKKANESMAHTYAHLYGLPCTGLRFFTVYGPWGRPDMSLFMFTRNILAGEPIQVFNHGKHSRDFTYVDDIVEGVVRVTDHVATPDPEWHAERPNPGTSSAPWRLYNIGSNRPVELLRFIELIEEGLGREAIRELLPMQPGDVEATYADVTALSEVIGYRPTTTVEDGIARFLEWYLDYHGVRR